MRNNKGKLVGILGAVIIHLIAAIVFMSFKLQSLQIENSQNFLVEFAPVEEPLLNEKPIELPFSAVENVIMSDQEILNIARNLANKTEVKINAADYIDQVKDELIKSGKLGKDNYIDERKRLNEMSAEEKIALDNRNAEKVENEVSKESQEMAANYKGPTRIYYDLPGRYGTNLPIPIYKCQGAGKVVLTIEVSRKGEVLNAKIIAAESTTSDPCLTETAVNTALVSRFNPDINSPEKQTGTLTYHFVAQ
jgi:hypothetical protein